MFGEFIKNNRLTKSLTLREFCKLIEVDASNWSKVERGLLAPPQEDKKLKRIAEVLGIKPKSALWQEMKDKANIQMGSIPKDILSDQKVLNAQKENGLIVYRIIMKPEDVGKWRFCPACGRPIMPPEYPSEDPESDTFHFEDVRCSCCQRPWIACPCTPMSEGECQSIVKTCDTCKFYIKPENQMFHGPLSCSSLKFKLSYGKIQMEPDEVQIEGDEGWGFAAGPKFGCIHWQEKK